jgi:hypothetical protein
MTLCESAVPTALEGARSAAKVTSVDAAHPVTAPTGLQLFRTAVKVVSDPPYHPLADGGVEACPHGVLFPLAEFWPAFVASVKRSAGIRYGLPAGKQRAVGSSRIARVAAAALLALPKSETVE